MGTRTRPLLSEDQAVCGSVLNAFALPCLSDPCVLFTQPLLRELEAPEIVGVFAHEVAHHEDFDPATLRHWRLVSLLLIIGGAAGAATLPLFPESWLPSCWRFPGPSVRRWRLLWLPGPLHA